MQFTPSPIRLVLCAALWIALAGPAAAQAPAVRSPSADVAEARAALDAYGGQREKLDRAKLILDRVLADDPANVEAMKQLARHTQMGGMIGGGTIKFRGRRVSATRYQPGTLEKAEALLREAVKVDPKFAGGYVLLGHVLAQQLRPEDAADALRKADALGTEDPWLQLNWASVHELLGETEAAKKRWMGVLEGGTSNERALMRAYEFAIDYLRGQEKHDEAIVAWRDQIARWPREAWLRGNLAIYLHSLGRYEECIVEARGALRIMDYGFGRGTLTGCLYSRWAQLILEGKRDEAQAIFEQAWKMDSDTNSLMVRVAQANPQKDLVRVLVQEKRASIDARAQDGSSSLLIATNRNDADTVRFLLEMGADPNTRSGNGWTPLLSAADEGNAELVRVLLAAGADRGVMRKGLNAEGIAHAKGRPDLAREIREFK